jgi:polyvinyl alcohol dehydrogenase (cytochrome)
MPSRFPAPSTPLLASLAMALAAAGAFGISCGSSGSSPSSGSSAPATPQPSCGPDTPDWPMFGQNVCNTASASPLNAGMISKDTVGKLAPKWVYDKAAGAAGDVSATPAVVAGSVYFPDWGGMINRLDAATGKVIWTKSVADLLTAAGFPGSLGGFVSRTTPLVTAGLVIFGTYRDPPQIATSPGPGAYLLAIDQNTAAVKWGILLDNHPLGYIESSPVLEGNKLYVGVTSGEELSSLASTFGIKYQCCSFRGSVAAVDVTTGIVAWTVHTISDELYYYNDAGVYPEAGAADAAPPPVAGYSGASVWSSTPVIDRKRKQLIITTGDNYKLPPGGTGTPPGNWVDSVVALDLATGNTNWATQLPNGGKGPSDAFAFGVSMGPDTDFGAGANLFNAVINGNPRDLVGAGQKSGVYFALDAQTGAIVWQTPIGPGGSNGGMVWGTATDGVRIYTSNNNSGGAALTLKGSGALAGQTVTTGVWTALDTATGHVAWQIGNPVLPKPLNAATVNGPVVVANGVMFGGSMDANGTMFALDAATGDVLWKFQSGGTVYGGPAIAGGMVFWGSGYPGQGGLLMAKRPLGFGTSSTKGQLYAFALPK